MAAPPIPSSIRKMETYNPDKIALIKQSLQQLVDAGTPRFYEIQVDGLKMVGKTTDLTRFDNYETYLSDETEEIKFMLYQGNSHKYDCFTHTFREDITPAPLPKASLNAVPELVEDKIKQALRERDVVDYKKRITELEEELEENKDYVIALENQVETLQAKLTEQTNLANAKLSSNEIWLSLLKGGSDFIKRNPQVLSKIPYVGDTLAGDFQKQNLEEELRIQQEYILLKHEEKQRQLAEQPEPNVTFKEKEQ
jgi:frataxin-like iron-binding protein CyaY